MSINVLGYIAGKMQELEIPYAFMEWAGEPASFYFVGEYTEVETMTRDEDGRQETSVILRGFTRGSWLSLETAKAQIERAFPTTEILDDGTGLAVLYDYALVVPTGDPELKSIKINLTVQEWRVNNGN